jgi:hypothetical protein
MELIDAIRIHLEGTRFKVEGAANARGHTISRGTLCVAYVETASWRGGVKLWFEEHVVNGAACALIDFHDPNSFDEFDMRLARSMKKIDALLLGKHG